MFYRCEGGGTVAGCGRIGLKILRDRGEIAIRYREKGAEEYEGIRETTIFISTLSRNLIILLELLLEIIIFRNYLFRSYGD